MAQICENCKHLMQDENEDGILIWVCWGDCDNDIHDNFKCCPGFHPSE